MTSKTPRRQRTRGSKAFKRDNGVKKPKFVARTGAHGLDLPAADATITLMTQYIEHLEILVQRFGNRLDKRGMRVSMHTDTPWTRNFAARYKSLLEGASDGRPVQVVGRDSRTKRAR